MQRAARVKVKKAVHDTKIAAAASDWRRPRGERAEKAKRK
jgi:hypothetical protein